MRQASEVVMEESTARALQELLSPHRDTSGLRSDLAKLAAEFVRVTSLIGGAVTIMAQSALSQSQRIGQHLRDWIVEFERNVNDMVANIIPTSTHQALEHLEGRIPKLNELTGVDQSAHQ